VPGTQTWPETPWRLIADAKSGQNDPDDEEDEGEGEEEAGSRARALGDLTQPVLKPRHELQRLQHRVAEL
jgi:hypothetical protein